MTLRRVRGVSLRGCTAWPCGGAPHSLAAVRGVAMTGAAVRGGLRRARRMRGGLATGAADARRGLATARRMRGVALRRARRGVALRLGQLHDVVFVCVLCNRCGRGRLHTPTSPEAARLSAVALRCPRGVSVRGRAAWPCDAFTASWAALRPSRRTGCRTTLPRSRRSESARADPSCRLRAAARGWAQRRL